MNVVNIKMPERVLFIINDNVIHGSVRFQKYGFLLYKQYTKELKNLKRKYQIEFYADWKPHLFGAYSKRLAEDIQVCCDDKLISKIVTKDDIKEMYTYKLTLKGRKRWRELFYEMDELRKFDEKIKYMQIIPYRTLLKQIYLAYPKYTDHSLIKEEVKDY